MSIAVKVMGAKGFSCNIEENMQISDLKTRVDGMMRKQGLSGTGVDDFQMFLGGTLLQGGTVKDWLLEPGSSVHIFFSGDLGKHQAPEAEGRPVARPRH
mmetsp:Transcript_47024/g.84768  ORF Transcript_47024/g.84768 Transcript_47024/m.84768 type:complete len:99 (+) Transcript_47024:98-394(+)